MIDIEGLIRLLLYGVPALHLLALVGYTVAFVSDGERARRLARPLLITAVAAHLAYLGFFTSYYGHIPMVSVPQVLGAVGFAVAATYLWIEGRTGTLHTGPFVILLALLCAVANTLQPRLDHEVPELLHSTIFSFHVSTAVLGYSAFALAGVYGLMYLLLYKEMRVKRFGLIFRRLPPLAVLDRMNFHAAIVGFGFLTLAIILGLSWTVHAFGSLALDPKLVVGMLTWTLYGLTVAGRQYKSWRGPRLAMSSLLGFVAVVASMFTVNFLFTKFHMFA